MIRFLRRKHTPKNKISAFNVEGRLPLAKHSLGELPPQNTVASNQNPAASKQKSGI
jgi:hypothetical protein